MGSRWRDGRSVLLVSAGGSDARTDASGMMAGLPCPGAATKAAGGSARAKISRGSRRSSRPASSQIEKNSSAKGKPSSSKKSTACGPAACLQHPRPDYGTVRLTTRVRLEPASQTATAGARALAPAPLGSYVHVYLQWRKGCLGKVGPYLALLLALSVPSC